MFFVVEMPVYISMEIDIYGTEYKYCADVKCPEVLQFSNVLCLIQHKANGLPLQIFRRALALRKSSYICVYYFDVGVQNKS